MPTPRTKSISTKVTEEEYALFESLAGEQPIVAELLALRVILLNALFSIANREPLTAQDMQDIINRADAGKSAKALERLGTTTGPQGR